MMMMLLLDYLLSGLCPSPTINFYSDFHITDQIENDASKAQPQG
jgi:hypothetical protein